MESQERPALLRVRQSTAGRCHNGLRPGGRAWARPVRPHSEGSLRRCEPQRPAGVEGTGMSDLNRNKVISDLNSILATGSVTWSGQAIVLSDDATLVHPGEGEEA